jgi:Sulfotransferase family
MAASSPLIIGATGGSGTRVVARIVQRAGYNLGTYVNEANDALALRPFHDRWINRFLHAQNAGSELSQFEREQMTREFQIALARHIAPNKESGSHWGWKAPRSIYLLPFFRTQFPDLKFIHVLRDGRDMAFSKNQNQLQKHGALVLERRERWFYPKPVRSVLLWARINLGAAEFAERQLGRNYFAVRFEDLCHQPVETTAGLLRFLNAQFDPESIARSEILAPESIGRWRAHSDRLISKMTAAGEIALRKFSYL